MIHHANHLMGCHGDGDYTGMVRCREDGALVLMMMVLKQAIIDVRLYVAPPEETGVTTRRGQISKEIRQRKRRIYASSAAAFLDGPEGRYISNVLHACGVQPPLRSCLRELQTLKLKQAA